MCDFHAVDFLGFKNIRVFFSRKQAVFCKKAGLKNFSNLTWKRLCQSLFLIKLQAEAYNFKETLAYVRNF